MTLAQLKSELSEIWAPLGTRVAFHAARENERVGLRDTHSFEVGSCFKAFVAAECCRQVSAGEQSWETQLPILASDRVPSSERLEGLPDGSSISLREATDAMLAVSDNTATDLVMKLIGVERVRDLLAVMRLNDTTIPDSVAAVFATATDTHARACITTMRDMVEFYRLTVQDNVLPQAARAEFRECMRAEDREQGRAWPEGVVCLRKSGSLEPPPAFVQAIAGCFLRDQEITSFAAAVNLEVAGNEIPEAEAGCFMSGLTHLIRSLSDSQP